MTTAQVTILRHYDTHNLGTTYYDQEHRWIWRSDIRADAQLADRYLAARPELQQ